MRCAIVRSEVCIVLGEEWSVHVLRGEECIVRGEERGV